MWDLGHVVTTIVSSSVKRGNSDEQLTGLSELAHITHIQQTQHTLSAMLALIIIINVTALIIF